jgi:hypothetical protein
MAMYKFHLTGKRSGHTLVLLDRYSFLNGEMVCSGKDAKAARPILCEFYGCTVEKLPDPEVEVTDGATLEIEDEDATIPVTPQPKPPQPVKPAKPAKPTEDELKAALEALPAAIEKGEYTSADYVVHQMRGHFGKLFTDGTKEQIEAMFKK